MYLYIPFHSIHYSYYYDYDTQHSISLAFVQRNNVLYGLDFRANGVAAALDRI